MKVFIVGVEAHTLDYKQPICFQFCDNTLDEDEAKGHAETKVTD